VLHLGFHHEGMFHKKVLNLLWEDFVSNPNDDVLQPSNYSSITILLQHELVSAYKQRNTADKTVMLIKWRIRRSLVGKGGRGGSLIVTVAFSSSSSSSIGPGD
jgi:hypothetical protein